MATAKRFVTAIISQFYDGYWSDKEDREITVQITHWGVKDKLSSSNSGHDVYVKTDCEAHTFEGRSEAKRFADRLNEAQVNGNVDEVLEESGFTLGGF